MNPISLATSPVPLRDALYALSLAQRVPDADLLDAMTRRYPEHAEALTEFAIELAIDALTDVDDAEDTEAVATPAAVSPVVSRAMSRFQNLRHAIAKSGTAQGKIESRSAEAVNPFALLDRKAFRSFASRIGANSVFVQSCETGKSNQRR